MTADLKELLEREAQRVRPRSAPIEAVVADGYGQLRRRRLGTVATAVVLAVLAAFGPTTFGWIGDDGSTVDRPGGEPSWGPYRVGNTVYLENGVHASVKNLADRMVEVPGGVVYATEAGDVVLMTHNGKRQQIGDRAGTHQGPIRERFPELASDPETGRVSWMEEHDGANYGEVVVYDTTAGQFGEEIDRRRIGYDGNRDCGGSRTASYGPFAVDDGAVYYCTGEGDFVWRPTDPDAAPQQILPVAGDPTTSDDYLLDVRAGLQVVLRYGDGGPRTEIMPVGTTQPATVIRRDLMDGFLSHDGRYLATLRQEAMNVYDTSTGERVTPDSLAGEDNRVQLAMTFTDGGGVAYALIHPSEGDTTIVTCALRAGECEAAVRGLDGGVFFANQRIQ